MTTTVLLTVFLLQTPGLALRVLTPNNSSGQRNLSDAEKVKDSCEKACPHDADSSCFTACETELYRCSSCSKMTPDVCKACRDAVIDKYQQFFAAKTGQAWFSQECSSACGDTNSTCFVRCQVGTHQCVAGQHSSVKTDACISNTLVAYRQLRANWIAQVGSCAASPPAFGARFCSSLCADGGEASCLKQCELQMYGCIDHNRTVPRTEYAACVAIVTESCITLPQGQRPRAVMMFRPVTQMLCREVCISQSEARRTCESTCPRGADSSCFTACETELYKCSSCSKMTPDVCKACRDAVHEKYKNFGLRDSSVRLLTTREGASPCLKACGGDSRSMCSARCQAGLSQCQRANGTFGQSGYQSCASETIASSAHLSRNWRRVLGAGVAQDLSFASSPCNSACGKHAAAACVPQCQVELHACLDRDAEVTQSVYDACAAVVLDRHDAASPAWNSTELCSYAADQ